MPKKTDSPVILAADDDKEDCLFIEKALRQSETLCILNVVHDGEQLLDYLYRTYAKRKFCTLGVIPEFFKKTTNVLHWMK